MNTGYRTRNTHASCCVVNSVSLVWEKVGRQLFPGHARARLDAKERWVYRTSCRDVLLQLPLRYMCWRLVESWSTSVRAPKLSQGFGHSLREDSEPELPRNACTEPARAHWAINSSQTTHTPTVAALGWCLLRHVLLQRDAVVGR